MQPFHSIFINVCNYTFPDNSVVPIGQLSLATYITENMDNTSARVIDLNYVYNSNTLQRSNNLQDMIMESAQYIIRDIAPNLISLYSMCSTHHYAIMLAHSLKQLCPDCVICLAGPQASIVAKETLEYYPFIDFIAIGEGELTIKNIIQGVKAGDYSKCKGIAYRENGVTHVIPNNELLQNLDDLPFINYNLLNFVPHDTISIEVGRGCPYACTFCSTNDFWKRKYRLKSPSRIFSEVSFLYHNFGIKKFGFEHDLFLINKKSVLEFCQMVMDSGLKINWGCSSRLDCIDEDLINVMAKAGCYRIFFGIETGSTRMQEIINKKLDLTRIPSLISQLKECNISPTFSFIYGFPEETVSDIEDTLKLIYYLYEQYRVNFFNGGTVLQLHKLMFLPGTQVTKQHLDELIPLAFLRTFVQTSETHWNSPVLNSMLSNKDIFPQYYGLPNIETSELSVLDAFITSQIFYTIEYLDCTYKALLFHFNEHIKIFYSFINTIGAQKLNTVQADHDKTVGDAIYAHMQLFKEYMDRSSFGENDTLIHDIFSFEYLIYCHAHAKNHFDKTHTFTYDVISMKGTRIINPSKKTTVLHFIKNAQSSRIIMIPTNQS